MAELTRTRPAPSTSDPTDGTRLPTVGPGVPAHVLSHASGGRDLWSEPMATSPDDPQEAILACLGEVLDPELPISLVDLGLIYAASLDEDRTARIDLTFTATACPCMAFIREDITDRLEQEAWVDAVAIREVWDPPWTRDRITERGRRQLRELGVGV